MNTETNDCNPRRGMAYFAVGPQQCTDADLFIDRQRRIIEEYANDNGIELVAAFEARNADRRQSGMPNIAAVVEAAGSHRCSILIVCRYASLGRHMTKFITELEQLGVAVVSATESNDPMLRSLLWSMSVFDSSTSNA